MAATATLAEMRATARELADMEESTFISDAWLNKRINEHCERLYDKLILAHGELHYAESTATTSEADKALYLFGELGAGDFYRLIGLIIDDGDQYAEVPTYQLEELPRLLRIENSGGISSVYQLRKQVRPTGIDIRPAMASTSYTITLHYIPAMTELVDDQDTFDGVNGWERWACLGAAIDMRNKEEADTQGLYAARKEMEADIDVLAATRDASRPLRRKLTRRSHSRRRYWRDLEL